MAFIKIAESAAALAKKVRTILVGDEHLQTMVPHAPDGSPLATGAGPGDATTPRVIHASNDPLLALIGEVQANPTAFTLLERLKAIETAIGGIPGGGGGGGDVNLVDIGGTAAATGAGAVNPGTLRIALANDDVVAAVLGAINGAAVVTDANGTVQQYLRGLIKILAAALGAGTAAAAIRHTLASDDPAVSVLGATAGAAVTSDANGTIQQYLRGAIKVLGAINGAAVTSDADGTLQQYLRGVIKAVGAINGNEVLTDADGTLQQYLRGLVIMSGAGRTDAVYSAGTAITPKFAAIAASGSGNNTVVSAVASKKIRVTSYVLMGNGAVNAKFQSGAGGTDLTGLKYIAAAGGGCVAPYNPTGWFETGVNTLLNLNLSGAVAVGGELTYLEV